MNKKKNKPGQGRKPLGQDRGGLVMISANIFADQAEKLRAMEERGSAQAFIRLALDSAIEKMDNAAKKHEWGVCKNCGKPLHKFHHCLLNPVAEPEG